MSDRKPDAGSKLRPVTRADLATPATVEGPGDGPLARALLAWNRGGPDADERLLAALRGIVLPPDVTPEAFLARLKEP